MSHETDRLPKRIAKTYKTLKQAEQYHARLSNRYYSVQLVEFPRSTEAGRYVWQVTGGND